MKKILLRCGALVLTAAMCLPYALARPAEENYMVRVGLNYGSSTLASANLQNNTGYGEGYRFGYYRKC